MRNHAKAAAGAAVAVLSLASATAFAQPTDGQKTQPERQMNQEMMQGGQGMADRNMSMMQDAKMRGQMMQMMSACEKMMQGTQGGSPAA